MNGWVKLHLIVEGETELAFARQTLRPHLFHFHVSVNAFMLPTNRKLNAAGGALSWDRFNHNVSRLLKQYSEKTDRFSTMVDWYKLDPKFPGYDEARKRSSKTSNRAIIVEQAVQKHFDSPRLFPFFTLHEFEALLFCDLSVVAKRMPFHQNEIENLKSKIGSTPPEDINDGESTHPAARLESHAPGYSRAKVRVGAPAAGEIGISALRQKCPHFNGWIELLEKLATN